VDVTPEEALATGWDFFSKIQVPNGQWAGDYGGPLFLMPGLVITCFLAGVDLRERASAMTTYLRNHQQADGGWGLHIEGPSTVFGTAMNYTALRLLGMSPEDPAAVEARSFLHAHGGAVGVPHWGKFWLAVLGCYEWDGVNPIPPELWMLPRWSPFHPGKMWCHCRMVYLPMSYVYGVKGTAKIGPIQEALRRELYVQPYESINWDAARNTCATIDLYAPHTALMEVGFWFLKRWEQWAPAFLRKPLMDRGLAFAYEYINAEDLQTNYVDIGPVNKVINMLSVFFSDGADSDTFRRHTARIDDYLWVAEDGMKMQGYNGSQLWDTAFAMQAISVDRAQSAKHASMLHRAYLYVSASQARDDVPKRERFFRTISKGGWPFSTNDHGWPIADCTSEGLKAALAVHSLYNASVIRMGPGPADAFGGYDSKPGALPGLIPPQRMYDAVNVILAFHNPDGGWATYEEMRGGPWYEYLNPAEVFGDIMIDYTYTELTSACVTALVQFQRAFPQHRTRDISHAISRGVQYVREQQREDGSWYGSWAVCFTYGCWFGVEALTQGGEPFGRDKAALERCCRFLLSVQRADGGWGESYLSCLKKEYSQGESTAVNTAWALLALIHARCPDSLAVRRGIDFLIARQTVQGDWLQESIAGIFNRTCSITYTTYRNAFPLWALAAYINQYPYRIAMPITRHITFPDLTASAPASHAIAAIPTPGSAARGRSPKPNPRVATPAPATPATAPGSAASRGRSATRAAPLSATPRSAVKAAQSPTSSKKAAQSPAKKRQSPAPTPATAKSAAKTAAPPSSTRRRSEGRRTEAMEAEPKKEKRKKSKSTSKRSKKDE
jgi:squalene/oxidosqualene cyclase-like protein